MSTSFTLYLNENLILFLLWYHTCWNFGKGGMYRKFSCSVVFVFSCFRVAPAFDWRWELIRASVLVFGVSMILWDSFLFPDFLLDSCWDGDSLCQASHYFGGKFVLCLLWKILKKCEATFRCSENQALVPGRALRIRGIIVSDISGALVCHPASIFALALSSISCIMVGLLS